MTKPKFSKGDMVYLVRENGARTYFRIGYVSVHPNGIKYAICDTHIYVEEERLHPGDVLDLMIEAVGRDD